AIAHAVQLVVADAEQRPPVLRDRELRAEAPGGTHRLLEHGMGMDIDAARGRDSGHRRPPLGVSRRACRRTRALSIYIEIDIIEFDIMQVGTPACRCARA